jgi:hypothetical protein
VNATTWSSRQRTWAEARKETKERENAAIHKVILRAIENHTLGPTSPWFGMTAADYLEARP